MSKCREFYTDMTENMFCAASKNAHICLGDSGGPAIIEDKLAGITSFTLAGNCETDEGSGFTLIYKYKDWIKEKSGLIF